MCIISKHSKSLSKIGVLGHDNSRIQYRAGRKNQRLSRNSAKVVTETNINAVTAEKSSDESVSESISLLDSEKEPRLNEIRRLQRKDSELLPIFQYLEDGNS